MNNKSIFYIYSRTKSPSNLLYELQVLKLANSDVADGLSIKTEFVGARSLPQINILGFESLETESYNHSGLKFQDNPIETMQLEEQPNQLQIADLNEKIWKSMANEDLVQAPVSDEANVANEHFFEKDNEVKKIELRPTLEENNSITTSKETHRNLVSVRIPNKHICIFFSSFLFTLILELISFLFFHRSVKLRSHLIRI